MKLPFIFFCEDNGFAFDFTVQERQGFRSIPAIAKAFRCLFLHSKSTDAEVIHKLTLRAMRHIQKTRTPVFMHLKYYRMLQHIGINSDFDKNAPAPKGGFEKIDYRSQKEYDRWLKKDPIKVSRAKLTALGIPEREIRKIEEIIDRQVEKSIILAKKAQFPSKSELYEHVYA